MAQGYGSQQYRKGTSYTPQASNSSTGGYFGSGGSTPSYQNFGNYGNNPSGIGSGGAGLGANDGPGGAGQALGQNAGPGGFVSGMEGTANNVPGYSPDFTYGSINAGGMSTMPGSGTYGAVNPYNGQQISYSGSPAGSSQTLSTGGAPQPSFMGGQVGGSAAGFWENYGERARRQHEAQQAQAAYEQQVYDDYMMSAQERQMEQHQAFLDANPSWVSPDQAAANRQTNADMRAAEDALRAQYPGGIPNDVHQQMLSQFGMQAGGNTGQSQLGAAMQSGTGDMPSGAEMAAFGSGPVNQGVQGQPQSRYEQMAVNPQRYGALPISQLQNIANNDTTKTSLRGPIADESARLAQMELARRGSAANQQAVGNQQAQDPFFGGGNELVRNGQGGLTMAPGGQVTVPYNTAPAADYAQYLSPGYNPHGDWSLPGMPTGQGVGGDTGPSAGGGIPLALWDPVDPSQWEIRDGMAYPRQGGGQQQRPDFSGQPFGGTGGDVLPIKPMQVDPNSGGIEGMLNAMRGDGPFAPDMLDVTTPENIFQAVISQRSGGSQGIAGGYSDPDDPYANLVPGMGGGGFWQGLPGSYNPFAGTPYEQYVNAGVGGGAGGGTDGMYAVPGFEQGRDMSRLGGDIGPANGDTIGPGRGVLPNGQPYVFGPDDMPVDPSTGQPIRPPQQMPGGVAQNPFEKQPGFVTGQSQPQGRPSTGNPIWGPQPQEQSNPYPGTTRTLPVGQGHPPGISGSMAIGPDGKPYGGTPNLSRPEPQIPTPQQPAGYGDDVFTPPNQVGGANQSYQGQVDSLVNAIRNAQSPEEETALVQQLNQLRNAGNVSGQLASKANQNFANRGVTNLPYNADSMLAMLLGNPQFN